MTKEFEISKEVELQATPEQVWEAIATGPGLASWLFPHSVDPGVGGKLRLEVAGYTEESTITGWDPPRRLTVESPPGEDGTLMAFEYLIEGRDGGSTVLKFVHSGHLGEGWGDEYIIMTGHGWDQYLHSLSEYLTHFLGRHAVYVLAEGPKEQTEVWPAFAAALGLTQMPSPGDTVRLPHGAQGVVDYTVEPAFYGFFLGVRTDDGLYRFQGKPDSVDIAHHLFGADVDQKESERYWREWIAGVYA
ncbi:SRPBCC domain-containing protein [Nonomuraea sp. NPDC050663]|uniref:SRPBCC domain-containing protein n=1 Tax=Nonomuraea sp. NPDC050663 TaxID=3364370 RepID=UPI00379327FE